MARVWAIDTVVNDMLIIPTRSSFAGQSVAEPWMESRVASNAPKGRETKSTGAAESGQDAPAGFGITMAANWNYYAQASDSEGPDSEDDYNDMPCADAVPLHEQAGFVASKGVTPADFRRKGTRALSMPPPARGRSGQCISLYRGGDASSWWWTWEKLHVSTTDTKTGHDETTQRT